MDYRASYWFRPRRPWRVSMKYSRNGISIAYLLPRKVLLHCLSINIIWPVRPFFITGAAKHPTFLNSTISRRTQNTEYSTNAPLDPQIGLVSLRNKPQIDPPLLLYYGPPNSFDRFFPSTNYIPNKIPGNPLQIL